MVGTGGCSTLKSCESRHLQGRPWQRARASWRHGKRAVRRQRSIGGGGARTSPGGARRGQQAGGQGQARGTHGEWREAGRRAGGGGLVRGGAGGARTGRLVRLKGLRWSKKRGRMAAEAPRAPFEPRRRANSFPTRAWAHGGQQPPTAASLRALAASYHARRSWGMQSAARHSRCSPAVVPAAAALHDRRRVLRQV